MAIPQPATVASASGTPRRRDAVIIGAGAAGLAAGKAMIDRGFDIAWFERNEHVGGLWQIANPDAAAYESLHTNSSKELTQYPSFPMPADWPDYPSHRLMAEYFTDFAEHFGLTERITFGTGVARVDPIADGGWRVTTDAGDHVDTGNVLIANGHHGVPRIPDFPGTFGGETMHSHDYMSAEVFRGKRVLVIGVGNSGMDIACDASRVAASVDLVTRHGVYVIPKYVLGRPTDHWQWSVTARLPHELERTILAGINRVVVGSPQRRGLPKPDHGFLQAHPTISAELLDRIGHGELVMRPDVDRFDGETVRFVDGARTDIDLVVFATGYQITLPFLDPQLLDPRDNDLRLYQRVVEPDLPGLWFLGFIQTVGAGIALFEHQAEWVGDLLTGACALPSDAAMRDWIERDQQALAKHYVRSKRHTIQVEYWRYVHALQAERRRADPSLLQRLRAAAPV
jgi:dimethylaniline monooxygenase (N-oxide forming)